MSTGSDERLNSNLLATLRDDDFALIEPCLTKERRETGDLLYRPGDDVAQVYFPLGPSLVSYRVTNPDGRDVETILVGREGAVGGIVSSGYLPAYCLITVKFGGPFLKAPVSGVQAAKEKSASMRRLFSRYADCLMAQMFQASACNAVHSIEQRTAKWILAAMDRTGNHEVPLTHEELASMMGVGRSYATRVLQKFRTEGILSTARGALIVNDRKALLRCSCTCHESVRAHFQLVLDGVYPENEAEDSVVS